MTSLIHSVARAARRPPRPVLQLVATAMTLLAVVGTYAAWTLGSSSSGNVVSSASEYAPPVNQVLPTVSGTEREGQTLTAANGTWTGAGQPFTYEYQWLRCDTAGNGCVEIPGANAQAYTLTHDDVVPYDGASIRVQVWATSAHGQGFAESEPTGTIFAKTPVNLTPPTMTGTPHENQTLTITSPGTWDGSTPPPLIYVYGFQRCNASGESCVALPSGSTTTTYIVSHDDIGSTIRGVVYALNDGSLPGGGIAGAVTAPTAVVTGFSNYPDLAGYATDGTVNSLMRYDGATFLGGAFSLVGKPVGSFARVNASGTSDFSMPVVTGGYVNAVESDGAGGWYIGGSFTRVGDFNRLRVAHIYADGTVNPDFNPGANDSIFHMEYDGTNIYVGGRFTEIGGEARSKLATLDPYDGQVRSWNPGADGDVYTLLLNGSTIYVGGSFNNAGGAARSNLAELSTTTGAATSLLVNPSGPVLSLVKSGTTLYIGGTFPAIFGGALPRGSAAAVNTATGSALPWNPNANGRVRELTLDGTRMYMGGEFTTIGGASHSALVGVDATTGAVNWNPPDFAGDFASFGTGVWVMHVAGPNLWVGGEFRTVGGQSRKGLASFDTATATLTSWAPQTSGAVRTTAIQGAYMYVGGSTDAAGNVFMHQVVERANAAAFDSSGTPTAWNPAPGGTVRALAALGGKIQLGGDFTTVAGQARLRLAEVNTSTGALEPWNPAANGTVRAMTVIGSNLHVGGDFTAIGAMTRNRLAAFAPANSTPNTWNPNANGPVHTIYANSLSLTYIGGEFTMVGASARNRLAQVSHLGAGAVQSWNPGTTGANATVRTIWSAGSGAPLYIGGDFTTIGTTTRNRVASVNTSGTLQAWNPNANAPVHVLKGYGQTVWAGGQFTTIGGQNRTYFAGLRTSDGTANTWNPWPQGPIYAIAADDGGVNFGGDFKLLRQYAPQSHAHFP